MSGRKPSKTRRRKTSVGELTPLGYLFDRMHDETVPHKQRMAIAVKLAPCFHRKLKPVRPADLDDPTEGEHAISDADQRERIRRKIFGRFD